MNTSFISLPPESGLTEMGTTVESKASDLIEKINFEILGADPNALGQKIRDLKTNNDSPANHYVEYAEQYEKAKTVSNLQGAVESLYLFEMALHSNEAIQLGRLQKLTKFFSEKDFDGKSKTIEANTLINDFLNEHPTEVRGDDIIFAK